MLLRINREAQMAQQKIEVPQLNSFCYDRDLPLVSRVGSWEHRHYARENSVLDRDQEDEPVEDEHQFALDHDLDWDPTRGHGWFYYESGNARSRKKAFTLRSWRNLKALGGSCIRKAIARKMDLRRQCISVPFG